MCACACPMAQIGSTTLDALPMDTAPLTKLVPKKTSNDDFEASVNETLVKSYGITLRPRAAPLGGGGGAAGAAAAGAGLLLHGLRSVRALPMPLPHAQSAAAASARSASGNGPDGT